MKILITGATGFIGKHLVKNLSNEHRIRVLLRKPTDNIKGKNIEIVYGDLTLPSSLKDIAKGIDIVYHLASLRPNEAYSYKEYWDVNLKGTKYLLEDCKCKVKRFIFASTVGGGRDSASGKTIDGSCWYNPKNIYEKTKCEAEKEVLKYSNDMDVVIARLSFVYGPGNLPMLKMFNLIKNNKFWIIGKGNNLLQPTYIDDLIRGLMLFLDKKRIESRIYNLLGREVISFSDFLRVITNEMDINKPDKHAPYFPIKFLLSILKFNNKLLKKSDPKLEVLDYFMTNHVYDISKTEKELDYKPKVVLKEGIMRTIDWYKTQSILQ